MQNKLFSFDSAIFPECHFFKNCTELDRIYDVIPWQELERLLPQKKNPEGAYSYLPQQGYFGLMFLKHYTCLSDEKLLATFRLTGHVSSEIAINKKTSLWKNISIM